LKLHSKSHCLTAMTFLFFLVLPIGSHIGISNDVTRIDRFLTGDFSNSETLTLVIQDRESTTNLQIPFEFDIYEDNDGFFSVGLSFDGPQVSYHKDLRTLHTEFMKSNIDNFPFLYINGTEEFDYWTPKTPNTTFIEANGYLGFFGRGWLFSLGKLTQLELEDVTCMGNVISIFDMNTTFEVGEGETDVITIGVVPSRITFGINFTRLENNVWSSSIIYESSNPSNSTIEGNTITAFFTESLPADPAFQISIIVVTISIVGIASVLIYLIKRISKVKVVD
jgi:hypothetical protein